MRLYSSRRTLADTWFATIFSKVEIGRKVEHVDAKHTKGLDGKDAFLKLVDFKWLMAGVGWWVDLSRLQSDRAYADECLQRALRSDSELLRKHGVELFGLPHRSDAELDAATTASR